MLWLSHRLSGTLLCHRPMERGAPPRHLRRRLDGSPGGPRPSGPGDSAACRAGRSGSGRDGRCATADRPRSGGRVRPTVRTDRRRSPTCAGPPRCAGVGRVDDAGPAGRAARVWPMYQRSRSGVAGFANDAHECDGQYFRDARGRPPPAGRGRGLIHQTPEDVDPCPLLGTAPGIGSADQTVVHRLATVGWSRGCHRRARQAASVRLSIADRIDGAIRRSSTRRSELCRRRTPAMSSPGDWA